MGGITYNSFKPQIWAVGIENDMLNDVAVSTDRNVDLYDTSYGTYSQVTQHIPSMKNRGLTSSDALRGP